jgi:hypothetical protein
MDEAVRAALATDRIIDITTTGRQTGQARRLETWLYRASGKLYLTGLPGRRGWYANIVADPALTLHVKTSATADLPATGRAITAEPERRTILAEILGERTASLASEEERSRYDLEKWVAGSPLIEVTLADATD